jgi:hypothetical protein
MGKGQVETQMCRAHKRRLWIVNPSAISDQVASGVSRTYDYSGIVLFYGEVHSPRVRDGGTRCGVPAQSDDRLDVGRSARNVTVNVSPTAGCAKTELKTRASSLKSYSSPRARAVIASVTVISSSKPRVLIGTAQLTWRAAETIQSCNDVN